MLAFCLHTEPDYERIVLGNEDRFVVNEWAFQYFQQAEPARQSREIAHEQVALRHPFCRGLVAEAESLDASRGIREGLVCFR